MYSSITLVFVSHWVPVTSQSITFQPITFQPITSAAHPSLYIYIIIKHIPTHTQTIHPDTTHYYYNKLGWAACSTTEMLFLMGYLHSKDWRPIDLNFSEETKAEDSIVHE